MKKLLWIFVSLFSFVLAVDHSTHWNAEDYHFNSEEQFHVAKSIVENLPLQKDAKVLDIGCGDGKITAMIQNKIAEGKVVGVDISPSMIMYAKKTFPNIDFEIKDAHYLNYDHEFDLIVSFTTMQWVTNQVQALSQIHKALKKGGRVIIEMPQALPEPLQKAVNTIITQKKWKHFFVNYTPKWRFYECEEYASLLENGHFIVDSVTSREIEHVFASRAHFAKFLQQWFPYLSQLSSNESKISFLNEVVDKYVNNLGIDTDTVPFKVRRLNAKARSY